MILKLLTVAYLFSLHCSRTSRDILSPQEAAFDAMAAREQEEERTQRVMLALNSLNPSYPGKENEDVKRILDEV